MHSSTDTSSPLRSTAASLSPSPSPAWSFFFIAVQVFDRLLLFKVIREDLIASFLFKYIFCCVILLEIEVSGLNRSGKSLRKIVICSTWIVIAVNKETLDMLTALGMGDIPGVRLESTELQTAPVGYGRGEPKRYESWYCVVPCEGILAVTKQIEILNSGLVYFLHEFCSLSKSLQMVQQLRLFRVEDQGLKTHHGLLLFDSDGIMKLGSTHKTEEQKDLIFMECNKIDVTPHGGWWSSRSWWFDGLDNRCAEEAWVSPDLALDSDLVICLVRGLKWWQGGTPAAMVVW
ncbi:hypothetical protein ACLB2K_035888 [Fragaria x ananassa]